MIEDRLTDTEISLSWEGREERERAEIPLDELHRLLANSRRRTLLEYLVPRSDNPVLLDDLVAVVAESERPDAEPATHRVRIATDLHHVHLQKFADAGVVSYDPSAETVQYHRSERLEALLAAGEDVDGRSE